MDRPRGINRLKGLKAPAVRDVALSFGTRVGLLGSGVLIQSLLAYALLPSGRGEFAVCIIFSSLLGVLLTPGADAGAQHFVMSGDLTLSQAVSTSLLICAAGSLVAAGVSLPLIGSSISFFQKADKDAFYLSLLLVPSNTFAAVLQNQLAGYKEFGRIAVYSFIRVATNILALVLFVYVLKLGVHGAIVAVGVASLALVICATRYLVAMRGLTFVSITRDSFRDLIRYGAKFYVARIGWGVDLRIGTLLLGVLATTAEVGLFSVGSGLMMQFVIVSNSIFAVLLPRATASEEGRPNLVAFCSRCSTWATGLFLVSFLALSEPLIQVLLSSAFLPIIPLANVIAPGLLIFAGANILTAYFRGINRPEVCSIAVALGLAANAVGVLLLYPAVGLVGAAYGMTIGFVVRSLVLFLAYRRIAGVSLAASWVPQVGDLSRLRAFGRKFITRRISVDQ